MKQFNLFLRCITVFCLLSIAYNINRLVPPSSEALSIPELPHFEDQVIPNSGFYKGTKFYLLSQDSEGQCALKQLHSDENYVWVPCNILEKVK